MPVTTFDFDPKLVKVIDQLKRDMNASSRSEVIRRAIALLKVASQTEKEGGEVVIKKGNKVRQVVVA